MKLRLPWQKEQPAAPVVATGPVACTHPRVEVEMHGTAIKRRWCPACGQELQLQSYEPADSEAESFRANFTCRSGHENVPLSIRQDDLTQWLLGPRE